MWADQVPPDSSQLGATSVSVVGSIGDDGDYFCGGTNGGCCWTGISVGLGHDLRALAAIAVSFVCVLYLAFAKVPSAMASDQSIFSWPSSVRWPRAHAFLNRPANRWLDSGNTGQVFPTRPGPQDPLQTRMRMHHGATGPASRSGPRKELGDQRPLLIPQLRLRARLGRSAISSIRRTSRPRNEPD